MNSTLVTVHNDVENAIVQGLAVAYDAPALLGLHDSYNNGSYVWSDGSKLNFQNWHDPPGDGDSCVSSDMTIGKIVIITTDAFESADIAMDDIIVTTVITDRIIMDIAQLLCTEKKKGAQNYNFSSCGSRENFN
uniref:C-type lectin domain-containing protein n=1 Tax=Acrobeloides nanus TaxID=290746 RepID=A0A914DMZ4_9BILA